jgi:hypothetical protein
MWWHWKKREKNILIVITSMGSHLHRQQEQHVIGFLLVLLYDFYWACFAVWGALTAL